MEVRAMEYRPVVPTGVIPTGLQDYHAAIPDLSPPRSQGSSTGGASSIGDYAPRMYTPPTPPTPHDDDKVNDHISFAPTPVFKVTPQVTPEARLLGPAATRLRGTVGVR